MRRFLPNLISILVVAGAAMVQAQPTFDPPQFLATGTAPDGLCVGDFDGDGLLDFAVSTEGPDAVTVWRNLGGGSFSPKQPFFTGPGTGAGALGAADMDQDGDLDLVVILKNVNRAQILDNNGAGAFLFGPGADTGDEPVDLSLADFDGDSRTDIVTANRSSDDASVIRNTVGGLVAFATLTGGARPESVAAADLHGDGRAEVIVGWHDTRNLSVHENVGGTFSAPVLYSVGGNVRPAGLAVADFDHANGLDFAAATSGNGLNQAAVFLQSAGGTFNGPANYPLGGVDSNGLVAADFDCDGFEDLAAANQTSNNASVIANQGNGTFGGATLYAAGTRPGRLVAGRFDADVDPELLVANRDSNNVASYENTSCNFVEIFATGFQVSPGIHLGGELPELRSGDDAYVSAQRNLAADEIGFPITVTVNGTSPIPNPTSFEFTAETRVDIPGLRQTIELWDWAANAWVQLDQRFVSTTDSVVSVSGTGTLSRFVDPGTLAVRARVGIEEVAVDSFVAWRAWFDQLRWTILP